MYMLMFIVYFISFLIIMMIVARVCDERSTPQIMSSPTPPLSPMST